MPAVATEAAPRLDDNARAFLRVADETPAMLWMSSAPGPSVRVNRRLAEFLGTEAAELGETWRGYVHPDDVRAAGVELATAVRERCDASFELRVRRHDGVWRWLHNVGTPRFAPGGGFLGFSGNLVDITERRDAERGLRLEAEASALLAGSLELDTLLDRLAALGVPLLGDACLLDLFRHGEHVRRMAAHCVSPEHRALMDEMLDRSGREAPDPYLLGRVLSTRQALLVPTVTDDLVQRVTGHDPRLGDIMRRSGLRSLLMVPLLARGEILGAISYIVVESDRRLGERELSLATAVAGRAAAALQNAELYAAARAEIAERTRAEAERAASEATLRGFLEAPGVHACVLEIDDEHDDFIFAAPNGPFAASYGFTAEEFNGTSARALGVPEDRLAWFLGILRACRDRGAPTTVEISPSKTVRPLSRLGSINPVRRASDGKTVLVYVGTDITERKRLEVQLQQSQKMEAVGRLAGGVAHDFNNLLTVIDGCVEFLIPELRPGEAPWHDAMQIRRAAQRGADLTRQLLTFSRRQVVRPRRVDVNALVQDTEKMFRRLLGEDVLFQLTLGAAAPSTYIDPGQLEQALVNLAVNARDAMPRGGRLGIATSNAQFDASDAAKHPGLVPGRYVCIAVSDTGVGMDAATQARIFEPFFTTKDPGKGTGLGLSTVFGIVQQAGGHVLVYSEPNVGTTFRVFLPGVPTPADDDAPAAATARGQRGSETVLLVEDEPVVRQLAHRALAERGFTVLIADCAARAVEVAAAFDGEIHIVVTDVVMPGQNGRELVEELRRCRPEIRALFMSGYTADVLLHHRIAEQSAPFLEKPFTVDDLVSAIRSVLDARVDA